jgi:hypothetical protein
MHIPYGEKKLILGKNLKKNSAKADQMLMEHALNKIYTPGLLEDPFYNNPMLTEALLEKYEVDFKKWLNSVLTPPEELESVDLAKVNVAEMWARSSRSDKGPVLAPSKEMVSSRYLSVEVNTKALCLIFQSKKIPLFSRDWTNSGMLPTPFLAKRRSRM